MNSFLCLPAIIIVVQGDYIAPPAPPGDQPSAPQCEDYNQLVGIFGRKFGMHSCAQVISFCERDLVIPAALLEQDLDDGVALPGSLQSALDDLKAAATGVKLSTVLGLACPMTCGTDCSADVEGEEDEGTGDSDNVDESSSVYTSPTPSPCQDYNQLVGTFGAAFSMSSCTQIKPFCANPMTIPAALIEQDVGYVLPPSLQVGLNQLKAAATGVKLSQVLSLACPVTCNSGCAAATSRKLRGSRP